MVRVLIYILNIIRWVIGGIIVVMGILGILSYLFSDVRSDEFGITSIVILFIGLCFYIPEIISVFKKRKQKILKKELLQEVIEVVKTLEEHKVFQKPLPTISTSSIFLKKDEEAYLEENVVFSEPRKHTLRYGGAMRITRGVYIGGTLPKIVDVITKVDEGSLVLTNKRIVFNGVHHTKSIDLEKILSVDAYSDGIAVGVEGKEKESIFSVRNPLKWRIWIYYLKTGNFPPEIKIEEVDKKP